MFTDLVLVCTFRSRYSPYYQFITSIDVRRQTKHYPDVPPHFHLSDVKGLSAAEEFVLRNVMDERVRALRVARPGEPIIFDVVSDAREFMGALLVSFLSSTGFLAALQGICGKS